MLSGADRAALLRHGVLGGTCFTLSLLLSWLLVDGLGVGVLSATAIGFVLMNGVSHHISRLWVFQVRRAGEQAPTYRRSLFRYLLVMGATLALNLLFMAVAVHVFGLHYLLASALLAALFFGVNFLLHRDWSFRA